MTRRRHDEASMTFIFARRNREDPYGAIQIAQVFATKHLADATVQLDVLRRESGPDEVIELFVRLC